MVSIVWYLNRVKLVFPEIPHLSFFEEVVDTHCVRDEWHLILEIKWKWRTSCLLCNSTRTAGMESGHGEWTVGWKRRRVEARQGGGIEAGEEGWSEADRTKEERKERGSEARQRTEESWSALRTSRGIRAVEFQPDFKTIEVWSKIYIYLDGHKIYG